MSVKFYRLKKPVAMEPWHMGVKVPGVLYVSSKHLLEGHPKKGDMIAIIEGQYTLVTAQEFARYQEIEDKAEVKRKEKGSTPPDTEDVVEKGRD